MKNFSDNLIKILSLGIGLAIGIVLIAKVCFELSYDSFYKDVDRIYCITENITHHIVHPNNRSDIAIFLRC